MLSERFPAAQAVGGRASSSAAGWATGVQALDGSLGGGLPRGALTELVGEGPGSGSAQTVHALLAGMTASGQFLALVDGADSFDVDAPAPESLARLLWVRCRTTEEALKAADLLVRDRNFPLVVLDLKLNPGAELRRIPSSTWHRLGRIVEHNGTCLLVITPFALAGAVSVRVVVRSGLAIDDLRSTPGELPGRLRFEVVRSVQANREAGWRAGTGAASA